MTRQSTWVARVVGILSAGVPFGIGCLVVLNQYPTRILAAPPSAEPHNVDTARSEKRPTIDEIHKLEVSALHAERKQKFDEASKGLEAALKLARQRFPDTHWIVRRIRGRQQYVSHLASLSPKDLLGHHSMECLLSMAADAFKEGHIDQMMVDIALGLASLDRIGGRDTSQHITLLKWLARVHRAKQHWEDEERVLKELQALVAKLHGEGDPDYGLAFSELARNMQARGKPREAEGLLDKARRLFESDLEGKEREYICMLDDEGSFWFDLSRFVRAENAFRTALAQAKALYSGDLQMQGLLLYKLALAHWRTGKLAVAKQELNDALELVRKLTPRNGKTEATILAAVGQMAVELEQYDEAEKCFRSALEEFAKVDCSREEHAAGALVGVGVVYARRRELAKAEEAVSKGVEIYRQQLGDSHEKTKEALSVMAQILAAAGKLDEAKRIESQGQPAEQK